MLRQRSLWIFDYDGTISIGVELVGRLVVGIDLGTSSCSVARVIDRDVQVMPVFAGRDEMPTYVAFTPDGERLVGWPAKRQAVTNPANTIFAIKRLIGRRFASEATQAELGLLPYRVLPSAAGGMWVEAGGRSYSPNMERGQRHPNYLGPPGGKT